LGVFKNREGEGRSGLSYREGVKFKKTRKQMGQRGLKRGGKTLDQRGGEKQKERNVRVGVEGRGAAWLWRGGKVQKVNYHDNKGTWSKGAIL